MHTVSTNQITEILLCAVDAVGLYLNRPYDKGLIAMRKA